MHFIATSKADNGVAASGGYQVAEAERLVGVVEELKVGVFANILRATRLRQFILQKIFTGKLV